jgi:hypothetical protein
MLKRNKTLKTLDLTSNNIEADGARHLAAALERNNTLTALAVGGNNIGDAGALHLAAALGQNVTLTWLDFSGNNIEDAGAAALRAALETNCTLDGFWGVDGVYDILKRNRGVRVARKQQVMPQCFFVVPQLMLLGSAFTLLWLCSD